MHKLLRDQGLLNSNEPFTRLLTQGMVLKDGSKMSKSKGNTVAPQPLIKKYGTDTVRLFILFAAPPEQSLEWSDSGVDGAHRFLKKLYKLAHKHQAVLTDYNTDAGNVLANIEDRKLIETYQQIHSILQQANNDMQRLQLNTVVSAAMKLLNVLSKIEANNETAIAILHQGMSILLRLLQPITPHISHQLWRELKFGDDILSSQWPKVNPKALQTSLLELVVQVNGKLRARIKVANDHDTENVKKIALDDANVKRFIEDKAIKKIIVIPKKLVNIVV